MTSCRRGADLRYGVLLMCLAFIADPEKTMHVLYVSGETDEARSSASLSSPGGAFQSFGRGRDVIARDVDWLAMQARLLAP